MKLRIQVNNMRSYELLAAYDKGSETYGYALDEGPIVQTGFPELSEAIVAGIEDILCLEGTQ